MTKYICIISVKYLAHKNLWSTWFVFRMLLWLKNTVFERLTPCNGPSNKYTKVIYVNLRVALEHVMLISSLCWQLLWFQPSCWQFSMDTSSPVHTTSSNQIGPLPAPYLFDSGTTSPLPKCMLYYINMQSYIIVQIMP